MRDLIKTFCEDMNLQFYNNYTGRFMYGKTCVGIVCDDLDDCKMELRDFLRNEDCDEDEIKSLFNSARHDSLGLSYILYFPKVA